MTEMTTDPLNERAAKLKPGISALVRSLLVDRDLDYEAILAEVRDAIPDARPLCGA